MGEYARLVASPRLAEMRAFSTAFQARYGDLVHRDPLDQWSRRWEYPFALEAVKEHVGPDAVSTCRVLDAGSGFTFFPFLLSEWLPTSVTCMDTSPALETAFRRASDDGYRVEFRLGDVTSTDEYPESSFDVIVCLSVLEHVPGGDRDRVLRELYRLLQPAGLLVLTFDVAVDGDYEIPLRDAEALLASLADAFPGSPVPGLGALEDVVRGDILTSRRVAATEPWRMPWSNRLNATLGSLRHGFRPRSFGFRNLTVWCGRVLREAPPG
jgi:SAM-dependent methyltransferase